jgi:hypothetical protein
LGIDPATVAQILALGDAAGKRATRQKKPRTTLLTQAERAVERGEAPTPLTFPTSNYWMQAKADELLAMALSGDAVGLAAYPVTGSNTYSRALRRYRVLCLEYVQKTDTVAQCALAAE